MKNENRYSEQTFKANDFCDHLLEILHLKNDAALSRVLQVAPPVISKIRNGRLEIGATFLLRAHEASCMSIAELRTLADIPPLLKAEKEGAK